MVTYLLNTFKSLKVLRVYHRYPSCLFIFFHPQRFSVDLVPSRLVPDPFRANNERKYLFPKNLVSVWVNKYVIDTDESSMFPFQLINVVSGKPDVLDFINDTPSNVFFTVKG